METDFSKFLDSLVLLEKVILKVSLDTYFKNHADNDIPNHINSVNITIITNQEKNHLDND